MFLKDSGLRVSDASKLNVGDYWGAEERSESGERFKAFEPFKTKKTGHYAFIHIGTEAVDAVDAYLEERKAEGEALTPESPLFAQRGGGRASSHALSNQMRRLCEKLGKEGRKVSAHSTRKFHRTMLESEMAGDWVKRLQGKAASEYSHPEQTGELTEAYIEAYDKLRVFKTGEVDYEARKDVEELREQFEGYSALMLDMAMAAPDLFGKILEKAKELRRKRGEA